MKPGTTSRVASFLATVCAAATVWSAPVKVILDMDIYGDYDDMGAIALIHALADRGEVEILAMTSCSRACASVATMEVVNTFYGRGDIPVGCSHMIGVISRGGGAACYSRLLKNYPGWWKYAFSSDAPDSNDVIMKALEGQPDGSVVICSTGYTTNMRRLLEAEGGLDLVRRKVKQWVAMACYYPVGTETNSREDAESSAIAFEKWPTPIVFSDYQYGRGVWTGSQVAKTQYPYPNPVKDVFAERLYECLDRGHPIWDQVAVLAAVRPHLFKIEPGRYRMLTHGTNEWVAAKSPDGGGRLLPTMPDAELEKLIDGLMAAPPRNPPPPPKAPVSAHAADRFAEGNEPPPGLWRRQIGELNKAAEAMRKAKRCDRVLLGDSTVLGWRTAGAEELARMKEGRSVLLLSIPGDRTPNILWWLRGTPVPNGYRADEVVVHVGADEIGDPAISAEDLATGVEEVVKTVLDRQRNAKVILTAAFPRGARPDDPLRAKVARLNELIRPIANESPRVHWMDLGNRLLAADGTLPAELFPDGVHPSAKAYGIWREALDK